LIRLIAVIDRLKQEKCNFCAYLEGFTWCILYCMRYTSCIPMVDICKHIA